MTKPKKRKYVWHFPKPEPPVWSQIFTEKVDEKYPAYKYGTNRHSAVMLYLQCSSASYWAWKSGRRKPGRKYLPKVAEIMEVSIERLIQLLAEGETVTATPSTGPASVDGADVHLGTEGPSPQ